MKRKITVILAVALAAMSVCGCAPKNGEKSGETPVLSWYLPISEQKDAPLIEEKVNEIVEPKIGAKVDFQYIDAGAFAERLSMMMASGNEFDITFAGYCNPYLKAVSLGGLTNLTEYIENSPALKEAIPDYAWKAVSTNSGIYAIPNVQYAVNWVVPIVQKEYADKYNLDVNSIKHINDIEPFLEQVKNNEQGVYAYQPAYGLDRWMGNESVKVSNECELLHININDPECKVYKMYENPGWMDGIKTTRSWFEKGYIRKDIASASSVDSVEKYVVFQEGNKPGHEALYKESNNGEEIVSIVLDKPVLDSSTLLAALTAVGGNSKNPELAVKLIEQVNTNKDVHRLIVHGIEGVHYDKIDDIHIKLKNTDKYKMTGFGWMIGNDFNSYLIEGQAADLAEQTAKLNEEAAKSPLLGFAFDSKAVTNEISNIAAVSGKFSGLSIGTIENYEETVQEYIAKLKEAGIDKVQEEMQRQIDEFLAKNK